MDNGIPLCGLLVSVVLLLLRLSYPHIVHVSFFERLLKRNISKLWNSNKAHFHVGEVP